MPNLLKRSTTVLFPALLTLCHTVSAQRCIILPPPRPEPIPRPIHYDLRLESLKVSIEIENNLARTIAEQTFRNDNPCSVEAIYLFPLPEKAVVSDFAMFINGKRVAGEVLDKDKARGIYEDFVRKLRDPGLLEYAGKGLFKASLFPVPANGEQKVQLEYSQHLPGDNGMYRYTFPLSLDELDARGDRDSKEPENLVIDGTLRCRSGIKTLYSPTHDIDVTRKGEHDAKFSLETKLLKKRKDFTLYYGVSDKDFGLHLVSYRKGDEDGYFLLTLSPRRDWQSEEITAKDVVFVLDTSGSMAGEKIEQAKKALTFCLDNLNREDRFDLVTFSTEVRTLGDTVIPASRENVGKAKDFVEDLKARGGTDIHEALVQALKVLGEHRDAGTGQKSPQLSESRMVVFITDGMPTVGETDETTILKEVRARNASESKIREANNDRPPVRIFTFGLGYDVNTQLLDRLAEENGATSDYVKPGEDMEVRISSFFEKVSYPVLSDLDLDWGSLNIYDLFPRELPDLFKGSQVMVLGRYKNAAETKLQLSGFAQGKRKQMVFALATPARDIDDDAIPRLWASRKVGHLLSEIRLHGEDKELKDEIVRLSLEFGILTPYTSMLVQEDEKRDRVVLAPQRSAGGGFGGGQAGPAGAAESAARSSFEAKQGRDGVDASVAIQSLRAAVKPYDQTSSSKSQSQIVRRVGNKTFYLVNGVWTDSLLKKDQKTVKIKYLSDAYFQLAAKDADLARYLSMGEKVIVCLPQAALEISEVGKDKLTPQELADLLR